MRPGGQLPAIVAACLAALAAGVTLAGATAEPLAAVAWPPSTGLLVGEVVTGGTSGSDEFVELYNAAGLPLDLGGLELVYVTSSGATVTRKATWSGGTLLPSGAHLLVANSAGIYAALADALYSGGFAATGGALVLRPIGGTPLDAVGWGDASSAFVERTAAPAPPAGQSIERRPGGLGGNGSDTNDNGQDFFVERAPAVQNLAAPPVPAPQATETAGPTETARPTETPTPGTPIPETPIPETPAPTRPEASASPTEAPTPSIAPTASPPATSAPTPSPTVAPIPSPTVTPTAAPTPFLTIAEARARANGSVVDVVATLTTPAGLIEGGTGSFVQDETAGISLYLATGDWPDAAPGTLVRVHGTVDDRYAQRTIRLGTASDIVPLGPGSMPAASRMSTGSAGEAVEGRLVTVTARVTSSAETLSDAIAVDVDDGSGVLRVVASLRSGVAAADLPAQAWFDLTGALGQRDSSGSGTQGYRLYVRSGADVVAVAAPSPTAAPSDAASPSAGASESPTTSASPTPTPSASPTIGPTPAPTPSASPSPGATAQPAIAIAAARILPLDTSVTVEGVVTVEPGRIIDERNAAIQDASAGIVVRLPSAGWPAFARGDLLRVTGVLGQRYGNLEVRPASAAAISRLGGGVLPTPRDLLASGLGEGVEGLLVRCRGVVVAVGSLGTTGSYSVDLKDASGTMRVYVYGTTGIARTTFAAGATVEVSGIEGQHAPSVGSTLGHRIWPRDPADIRWVTVSSTAAPSGSPVVTATPWPPGRGRVPIATAIASGGTVTVEGIVTTPDGFIDSEGRRVVIEDDSGALIARLPGEGTAPKVGTRVSASGEIGTYYGSPQLALSGALAVLGTGTVTPRTLAGVPGPELAWRLVRVSGRVTSVHRLGTTWRAELSVGGAAVPIYGAARSGIPSTALVEGRTATVTGVVRPPYPTATDRRAAIAPRFPADVSLGGPARGGGPGTGGAAGRGDGGPGPGDGDAVLDVELAELVDNEGALVRVGGLIVSVTPERVVIDDGTAVAAVILPADAASLAGDLRSGDPLNATGTVVRDGDGWAVRPASAADLARVGRLGELAPLATPPQAGPPDDGGAAAVPERLGSHGGWPFGLLPTGIAMAGSALVVALRRRAAIELARRGAALVAAHLGRQG